MEHDFFGLWSSISRIAFAAADLSGGGGQSEGGDADAAAEAGAGDAAQGADNQADAGFSNPLIDGLAEDTGEQVADAAADDGGEEVLEGDALWEKDPLAGFLSMFEEDAPDRQEEAPEDPVMVEDAQGYQFEFNDTVIEAFGDLSNDPTVEIMREAAFKHGLSNQQVNGLFNDFMGGALEQGIFDKPVDADAVYRDLAPQGENNPAAQIEAGKARVGENNLWFKQLVNRKIMTADQVGSLANVMTDKAGVEVIEVLRAQLSKPGLQTEGGADGGHFTESDLKRREADPRNNSQDPKYDPAFRKETDGLMMKVYG